LKNLAILVFILVSFSAFGEEGPTNIGSISMGMSKAEYLSAIGTISIDCNTFKSRDGRLNMGKMNKLDLSMTLCEISSLDRAIVENIQVDGISFDVVRATKKSSKVIDSLTYSSSSSSSVSKAIFLKDSLISFTIEDPKVNLEILTTKYGPPKIVDKTERDSCTKYSGEYSKRVGQIDNVWTNGSVSAIFRITLGPLRRLCASDTSASYIIEERKQLEPIEAAIINFRKKSKNENFEKEVKDSLF